MKIGFIGTGNLASALVAGMTLADPEIGKQIYVNNRTLEKGQAFCQKYGVNYMAPEDLIVNADLLFLTIKPKDYQAMLTGIKEYLEPHTTLVSVAAGISISYIEEILGPDAKVIRCMPNTPSMLGQGMNAICPNKNVTEAELSDVKALFDTFGSCQVVTENLFDTVTGVSGSGPAYVYMFIDAMAQAAIKDGMPEDQAIIFAAQTALGAASMVLSSGTDPATLTENVCSPGGTTIEAVDVFKKDGLYDLVYKAQHACVEKSKKMSK